MFEIEKLPVGPEIVSRDELPKSRPLPTLTEKEVRTRLLLSLTTDP